MRSRWRLPVTAIGRPATSPSTRTVERQLGAVDRVGERTLGDGQFFALRGDRHAAQQRKSRRSSCFTHGVLKLRRVPLPAMPYLARERC